MPYHEISNEKAFQTGKDFKKRNWGRTAPYYEESVVREGKRVDITEELEKYFFMGYDGLPSPFVSAEPAQVPSLQEDTVSPITTATPEQAIERSKAMAELDTL